MAGGLFKGFIWSEFLRALESFSGIYIYRHFVERLEASKFPWPKKLTSDSIEVNSDDMELLLQGINIWTRFEKLHFEQVV